MAEKDLAKMDGMGTPKNEEFVLDPSGSDAARRAFVLLQAFNRLDNGSTDLYENTESLTTGRVSNGSEKRNPHLDDTLSASGQGKSCRLEMGHDFWRASLVDDDIEDSDCLYENIEPSRTKRFSDVTPEKDPSLGLTVSTGVEKGVDRSLIENNHGSASLNEDDVEDDSHLYQNVFYKTGRSNNDTTECQQSLVHNSLTTSVQKGCEDLKLTRNPRRVTLVRHNVKDCNSLYENNGSPGSHQSSAGSAVRESSPSNHQKVGATSHRESGSVKYGSKSGNVVLEIDAFPGLSAALYRPFALPAVFFTTELLALQLVHGCYFDLPFPVDCIVNATDARLTISNSLMCAGGPNFEQACSRAVGYTGGFPVTQCCRTEGGDLSCKFVINAVCPTKKNAKEKLELKRLLYKTILNCFIMANDLRATSIALPTVGLECLKSKKKCARFLIDAILEFSRTHPESKRSLQVVYFTEFASKDILSTLHQLASEALGTNSSELFMSTQTDTSLGNFDTPDDRKVPVGLSASYRVQPSELFSESNPVVYHPNDGNFKVHLYMHDIRAVRTDAVLCPEDRQCVHGGRTAISLHQAFRRSMKTNKHGKIRKGGPGIKHSSVITTVSPEECPPKYVIHEPFPFWHSEDDDPVWFEENLASSIHSLLKGLLNKKRSKIEICSVAIPVLGINNLCQSPVSRCCSILATEVKAMCTSRNKCETSFKELHIICPCREIAEAMHGYFLQGRDSH